MSDSLILKYGSATGTEHFGPDDCLVPSPRELNGDFLPDDTVLLDLDPRMVCTACGTTGAPMPPPPVCGDQSGRTSARRAWRALRLRGNPALISGDSPIADEGGYYENCRAAVRSHLLTGGYLWGVLHQAFRPVVPRTADDDDRHDLSRAKRLAL